MNNSSWIEISKSALIHNAKQFKKIIAPAKLMAVVKSNAYGHGSDVVSKIVEPYVDWFGTANLTEAVSLRNLGIKKPILVLNYYSLDDVNRAVAKNINLVVYDMNQVKKIAGVVKKLRKVAEVQIKVDTGVSRLGLLPNQVSKFLTELKKFPNIRVVGIFSHLASSEDNAGYTQMQLTRFEDVLEDLKKHGTILPLIHIACTASSLAFPSTRFNLVRLGIGLYGLWSYKSVRSTLKKHKGFNLQPVLSWKTKIHFVKEVAADTFVGYGLTYKTTRKSKLAILPVGYFEGYDRGLSNNSYGLIKGKKCNVLGRIFMNLFIVDATDVKSVKAGDEVVLIGKQGKEYISADDLANRLGTINYEVVTRINPLLRRVVIK